MSRSLHRSVLRLGRWPRLCAAGICLLLALGSALGAARGRPQARAPRTVTVVVAARALPAGRVLSRRDVALARWPAALLPAGTEADPRRLVGERLAGPLAAREVVTPGRLLGADLTTGLGVDAVATPVIVDTDIGHLIHAGDRVDLVATPRPDLPGPDATGAQPERPPQVAAMLVARRARVLAVVDASADAVGPIGAEIVLATDRALALRIAGLRNTRTFAVVGDSP